MNNDITIDPKEILLLPDNSITDGETIHQIALYSIKTLDSSLNKKIKSGFEFAGLYPHVMKFTDIIPEGLNNKCHIITGKPGTGKSNIMEYLKDKYKKYNTLPETVSFDYDNTLTHPKIQRMAKIHLNAGDNVHIVSSRLSEMYDLDKNFIGTIDNEDVYELAKELGIPKENIHFTDQQLKLETLIKIGSSLHYDDDVIEIDDINRSDKDITGILINYKYSH